ncbi:MAG: phosphohydrolase [Flavobacteriales bacterium]|nr:phosphohydrolase [Flavobacteriales bacterium]
MKDKLNIFFRLQSKIFRIILFFVTVTLTVYLIPKNTKFKFDYKEGLPWNYETLISPFDFTIYKSNEEIEIEKKIVSSNSEKYFNLKIGILDSVLFKIDSLTKLLPQTVVYELDNRIKSIYKQGITDYNNELLIDSVILTVGSDERKINFLDIFQVSNFKFDGLTLLNTNDSLLVSNIFQNLKPNVFYDEKRTFDRLDFNLSQINLSRGIVRSGVRIISRGEIVDSEKLAILNSLKLKFESDSSSKSGSILISIGYFVIVALIILFLFLFLRKNRRSVFLNNTKMMLILTIVIIFISLISFTVKLQPNYIYAVPLCSIPLLLRAFFDSRLGLFTYVMTVLILSFFVPYGFEFIIINVLAGIVTILTPPDLYQRANLFLTVFIITLVYILSYFSIALYENPDFNYIDFSIIIIFLINGLATLFVHPMIYIFEKVFDLVSDVSLLELSNTNSGLLKKLSERAPGTFYHSLAVSSLAEAVAVQISGNVMLVRVGALYHDIGKMNNPNYFIENQTSSYNPHVDLDPTDSNEIIKNHISDGIKIAKKNKIPDRVIDFIRTHHGTMMIRFFYDKALKLDANTKELDFRYSGPKPFSKETAVVMMADSIEAASKSLDKPNIKLIEEFVEKIVDKQLVDNQFINCDITLKEIEISKKVFKEKLINIYHLRVEYPD